MGSREINQKIIIDTHILLWSLLEDDKLSKNEYEILKDAQINNNLILSSISLWEIAMLASKNRINIYGRLQDFLNSIENIKGLSIYNIDTEIAAESVSLPGNFHGDPADKIIVATARVLSSNMMTRDKNIITWAKQGYLKINKFNKQKA